MGETRILSGYVAPRPTACPQPACLHLQGSGDVKYHLGMSSDVTFEDSGKTMHVSLMANPSHLEAVNPVVEVRQRYGLVPGKRHGKIATLVWLCLPGQSQGGAGLPRRCGTQARRPSAATWRCGVCWTRYPAKACRSARLQQRDFFFRCTGPLLPGVVYETLGFSQLPDYTAGGTVHIVVNNQVPGPFPCFPAHTTPTPAPALACRSPSTHLPGFGSRCRSPCPAGMFFYVVVG